MLLNKANETLSQSLIDGLHRVSFKMSLFIDCLEDLGNFLKQYTIENCTFTELSYFYWFRNVLCSLMKTCQLHLNLRLSKAYMLVRFLLQGKHK